VAQLPKKNSTRAWLAGVLFGYAFAVDAGHAKGWEAPGREDLEKVYAAENPPHILVVGLTARVSYLQM